MILGLGIDMVDVGRVEQAHGRKGAAFLNRLFTPGEQAAAGDGPHRYRRLAARLAAKEALVKALGTGLRDGRWLDAEVVNDPLGKPSLRVTGGLARRLQAMGVTGVHLSLTHENHYAAAVVVLTGAPGGKP
ncbi:MAG TPA: holo-ACP synthase [Sphingobacteriaceae bacterium]|nr:holo-ACP synthase [Sphingobacteriaceae bacterium]